MAVLTVAAFVRTSTGFTAREATLEDVKLTKVFVGDKLSLKVAGGIRDFQTDRALVAAGATRLGCSSSVAIVTESSWNKYQFELIIKFRLRKIHQV